MRPLLLIQAFDYKFNKHGYLRKFKSRLYIRGDLQPFSGKEIYAATLIARNFRIIIAITAKFSIETRLLNAVNAFTNADLDKEVYIYFLDGFKVFSFIIRLIKALYRLRRSPLLQQQELSRSLTELGLQQSAEDPCIFISTISSIITFFFIDNIIILFRKEHYRATNDFIRRLKQKYIVTDRGELTYFLRIRIIQDYKQRKLQLYQDVYLDKIASKFSLILTSTVLRPISTLCLFLLPEKLEKHQGQATDN